MDVGGSHRTNQLRRSRADLILCFRATAALITGVTVGGSAACQMSASPTRASPDRGTPGSYPVAEGLQAIRATGYGPAGCWRRPRSPASMTRTHPEARLPDNINGTDQALHASSTPLSGHHSPATDDAPRDRQNGSGPRSPQNPHTTRASQAPPAPCGRRRSHAFTLFRGQISKLPR